jgi:hypothetical protein
MLGTALAAVLGDATLPGAAQAATRMAAKAMAVKGVADGIDPARWNRTLAMNAPPRCCP